MKTAISLTDELFEAIERLVKRSGRSRSDVYAEALREYLARHSADEVTGAVNAVMERLEPSEEEEAFLGSTARSTLSRTEW